MPLDQGRTRKTLWLLNGVFLFVGTLIAFFPADASLLLVCLPAFYCAQQLSLPGWQTAVFALAPMLLAFVDPRLAAGLSFYGLAIICGMLMCLGYARRRPALALALPIGLLLLVSLAGLLSMVAYDPADLSKAITSLIRAMVDGLVAVSPPQQRAEINLGRYELEARLIGFFPAILAMSFSLVVWLNLLLVNSFRHELELKAYKVSDWLLVPFIGAAAASLTVAGRLIGLNLLWMILIIYFFQGMAIAATYMERRRWPRFMKWLVYILLVIQLYIGVAALGLFDTWFNFRKKIGNSEGEE